MQYKIDNMDIIEWCEQYEGEPFMALLCDAPYSLNFMQSSWDDDIATRPETWAALAEHLLPGALLFVFAGSRTYHRIACALEDAGLIIAQPLHYLFGSGFPKNTNVSSQCRKERGVVKAQYGACISNGAMLNIPLAERATWLYQERSHNGRGYGITALKPMCELICVAQKPYDGKSVDSITRTGAGAYAIDAARLKTTDDLSVTPAPSKGWKQTSKLVGSVTDDWKKGRWPGNVALSEDAAAALDEQAGERPHGYRVNPSTQANSSFHNNNGVGERGYEDGPNASRFFKNTHYAAEAFERINAGYGGLYTGKAPKWQRGAGITGEPMAGTHNLSTNACGRCGLRVQANGSGKKCECGDSRETIKLDNASRNPHPTVKNISLTYWLSTLLAPPPEYAPRRLLVPFCGSGSEMIGALLTGQWEHIQGVELMPEYVAIAEQRLAFWNRFADAGGDIDQVLQRAKRTDRQESHQKEVGQMSLWEYQDETI